MDPSRSWVRSRSHLWFQRGLHRQTPPGWCRGLACKHTRDGIFSACREAEHSFLPYVSIVLSVTVKRGPSHWFMPTHCEPCSQGKPALTRGPSRSICCESLIHWTQAHAHQHPRPLSSLPLWQSTLTRLYTFQWCRKNKQQETTELR